MTPDPQTGLVAVVDRGTKTPTHHKMWPIDYKESVIRGGTLSDGGNRFVLAEHYKAPEAAVAPPSVPVTPAPVVAK